ncbi:MAG: MaoC family dehydratase [Hyphomonadaceae bacterium]
MKDQQRLTSRNNYFEDFEVGAVFRHARGKTITPLENVLITNMVMNTAQGHFNEHAMAETPFQKIVVYGGVNFSIVLGLASQDCCENALVELGLDEVRLTKMVGHGDTLYAISEVLEKKDSDREDAGVVLFEHTGINQNDEVIARVKRRVLIKRKSHWGGK